MTPVPDRMRRSFEAARSNRFLGMRLVDGSIDRAHLRMPVRPEYVQEEGVIHGGILTALADTTAVYAILPGLPEDRTVTGIELKVNFLRPALPEGEEISSRARVLHRGSRVAVAEVELSQGDRRVAKGIFTYLVTSRTGS